MKSPFTCSHWEEQNYRVFSKKIFCFAKDPFTHLDKGGRNAHPFLRFSKKNFYSAKISPHLFGITKPNDTLFHRKNEKIFFVRLLDGLFLLVQKSPFTYSHWEEANSNPVSKNILLFAKPLHLFGIRRLKRNLFFRKSRKIFLKKLFISKTSPHLFPLGEGIWG